MLPTGWWEWITNGAENNSSYGLDMALKELPYMYKDRFRANMGPDWTDEQGNIKQVMLACVDMRAQQPCVTQSYANGVRAHCRAGGAAPVHGLPVRARRRGS